MSLSSVTSTTSLASTLSKSSSLSKSKTAVKASQEYRALRQQFFHLQSSHNSLKLVHEREMILGAAQRGQLQEQIQLLQSALDEIKKDQVYILNSEQEALRAVEQLKEEKASLESLMKSQITQLEAQLSATSEARYNAETEVTRLRMISKSSDSSVHGFDEEFVSSLLEEWKDRAMALNTQKNQLEQELESIKSTTHNNIITPTSDSDHLRNQILSTYVSLESAQSVLSQRRAEAERLSARIGNVKVLEEKYRDALIRIRRLEAEIARSEDQDHNMDAADTRASTPVSTMQSSTSGSDLKLIQLTQELGALKESLAITQLAHSTLQTDYESSLSQLQALQVDLEESKKSMLKLQNSLKVKDSTITNLKDQLDSTVTLLTETLKKKK